MSMIQRLFSLGEVRGTDSVHLRHNLRVHIGDGSVYAFALSLIAVPTIIPVLLLQVGAGMSAIGAVPVLWTLGSNLPQGIYMHVMKPRTTPRRRMLFYGTIHRLCFFCIGMVTLLFGNGPHAGYAVPGILLFLMAAAVTGSLGSLHWFHLYAATTPVYLRGRLTALRQMLGSLFGVLGGSVVSLVLGAVAFPLNFSLLFFCASALMLLSVYILSHIIVPASVQSAPVRGRRRDLIAEGKRILSADKNFKSYLVADALVLMSMTASAFYAVHALEKFSLSVSYAGSFTVIVMTATVIGNIFFGLVADHLGNKVNLLAMALSSALASLTAVAAANVLSYGLVFVFMAAAIGLQAVSRLSFIAELCSEAERPVYVALANTITAPTIGVGILFGALVPRAGYDAVLVAAALLGLASFAILWFRVAEPRHAAS